MACRHIWKQINDVGVCRKCGLTISKKGEVMFDRRYTAGRKKKGGGKNEKNRRTVS